MQERIDPEKLAGNIRPPEGTYSPDTCARFDIVDSHIVTEGKSSGCGQKPSYTCDSGEFTFYEMMASSLQNG